MPSRTLDVSISNTANCREWRRMPYRNYVSPCGDDLHVLAVPTVINAIHAHARQTKKIYGKMKSAPEKENERVKELEREKKIGLVTLVCCSDNHDLTRRKTGRWDGRKSFECENQSRRINARNVQFVRDERITLSMHMHSNIAIAIYLQYCIFHLAFVVCRC